MKKIISLILVFLTITSSIVSISTTSYASEETIEMSVYENNIFKYYSSCDLKNLYNNDKYQYTNFARGIREDTITQYLFEMADILVQTGREPNQKQYMESLIAIMATYELDNATNISEQHKLDNNKSIKDYAMDIAEMGVDAVGVMTANSEAASKLENGLSIAIDGLGMLAENTDNWINALSDLETIVQNYATHDEFLEMIEKNSDGELKKAASTLRNGLSEAMKLKLESYNDVYEENFENYQEFFFEDVFFTALKNTEEYAEDSSLRVFVDGADNFVSKLGGIKSAWSLGTKIGMLVGDITVGGEQMINRTLEVLAIYDIGNALKAGLLNLENDVIDSVSVVHTENSVDGKIDRYISLSQYLIGCRIRGEYCFNSIVTKDTRLLAWFNKKTTEEANKNCNLIVKRLSNIQSNLLKVKETEVTISGRVTDENKLPLEDVLVTICDDNGKTRYTGTSNSEGYFEGNLDFIGKCIITYSKEGYDNIQFEGVIVVGANDFGIEKMVFNILLDDTYILPESNTRIYDVSEIQALTEEELELARNEIFARHGRKFKREDLQEYFEGKSWYEGTIEPDDFDDNTMLSDVEKANLELIRGVEEGASFRTEKTTEICNYLRNSEDMINNLKMEFNTEYYWFESSYKVDDLIFEIQDTENFQYIHMRNNNNDNVTLFGVKLGDTIDQAYNKIEEHGSMYVYSPQTYVGNDTETHIYICYQDEIYFLYLYYNSENVVTKWTFFNFFEGEPDEMLLDMLRTENLARNSMTNWQAAYIQYIKDKGWESNYSGYYRYALAYIDDDDVPELIQYGVSFADNGTISTYSDGQVYTKGIYNQESGASYYLNRGNMFYNCGGHMGLYYDNLYQIIDGEIVVLHAGCYEALDSSYEQYEYSWDNVSVNENTYNTNLKSCIDKSTAIRIEYEQMVTADEILKQILDVQ